MRSDRLLFGTAGIPISTEPRTYHNAFHDLIKFNLGCMEIEFVHGLNMNLKTQAEVKELSSSLGLVLSAHAPYYINLNAQEQDKVDASIKRILDTARVTALCGGYSTAIHAAFYMGKDKEDVYNLAKKLEPEKWLDILAQKELPEVLSKSWLGDRDSNPNRQSQSLQSYR